ncbi:OadG family protein [Photobacterium sp. TY1-4]|uniref:OadG family protein n=1 Tax=Photobacterium sp. TY1-4 TaxID=2899122 RepID=UPI0021BE42A8|nr:OadG family transporter subunit [Photobacterium sp. TY1-4]UXI02388.1 OadG family transporter subunit [Photobacterium sp. TY1-4]
MEQHLFAEGLNLLMLGMGFVMVFLVFLIFATTMLSQAVARFAPPPVIPKPKRTPQPASAQTNEQLVAVMAAAIHHKKITQSSRY